MIAALDRQAREPLGEQLTRVLRKELEEREHGSRFYGDRELCDRYGVSLPVVRAAMGNLVREGLVSRRPSRGTFVCKPRPVRQARAGQIAVLAPLPSEAHGPALQGIQAALAAVGRTAVMVSSPPWPLDFPTLGAFIEERLAHADGVILISAIREEWREPLPELERFARQLVMVNADLPGTRVSCLLGDYEAGAFKLASHLLASGRRRLAFVGAQSNRLVTNLRLAGYKAALQQHGRQPEEALIDYAGDEMSAQVARAAIGRILDRGAAPDAVFALTDYMAIGVLDALRDAGRRVPEDVAVTGFDNRDLCLHVTPTLTTAQLPYRELGIAAAELLIEQLDGEVSPGTRQYFPCPLLIRDSTLSIAPEKSASEEEKSA